ncbi:MAG: FAD-dependent oxidoreductase [Sphaerochaetaceae bacterium]
MKTIIIGNGISGYMVASALDKAGMEVLQFSEEPYGFYSRIKLPQALCDERALALLPTQVDPSYLRHQKVIALDIKGKQVILEDHSTESYDKLVLATGSRSRTLAQFDAIQGVHPLRTLSDAYALTKEMRGPVCVLGGGLLGLEVARTISGKGFAVTVLEGAAHILNRQLNVEASVLLKSRLENEGLHIEENFALSTVEQGEGSIVAVSSKDGRQRECRTMVLSLGVNPEVTLAREAGLIVSRGIVVNEKLESSAKDVYAIGDCAEHDNMVPGITSVASLMANTLVSLLQGKEAKYVSPPLMTRLKDDSFDLVSMGDVTGEVHHKEEGESHEFFFTKEGILCGVILFNASDKLSFAKASLGKSFSAF